MNDKFSPQTDATIERLSKLTEASGCPCYDLTELANEKFPKELSGLLVKDATHNVSVPESGRVMLSNVRFIGTYIENAHPTDDEIAAHVDSIIKNYGNDIDGWMVKLARISLPGFEGEEPTVEEFFSENFDSSRVKENHMLVSYPTVKIK